MPRSVQTLGVALERLPELTKNMLRREREKPVDLTDSPQDADSGPTQAPETILKTFVRLSDQSEEQADSRDITAGKSFLTEEEIAGNLFIFTAAGFDTTANTMGYAVTILAAYPQWQAWVQEEIDSLMGSPSTRSEDEPVLPDYATTFPRLIRCLAVMVCSILSFKLIRSRYKFIVTQRIAKQVYTDILSSSSRLYAFSRLSSPSHAPPQRTSISHPETRQSNHLCSKDLVPLM